MSLFLYSVAVSALVIFLAEKLYRRWMILSQLPPKIPAAPLVGWTQIAGGMAPQLALEHYRKTGQEVFTVECMGNIVLVNNSRAVAEELLVKRGSEFRNRPSYDNPFEEGPPTGYLRINDDVHKEQRRFALHTLRDLGFGKPKIEAKIAAQLKILVDQVSSQNQEPFFPRQILSQFAANVISEVVLGKAFDSSDPEWFPAIHRLSDISNNAVQTALLMAPPKSSQFLRFIPQVNKARSVVVHLVKTQASAISKVIAQRGENDWSESSDEPDTFVDAFKKKQREGEGQFFSQAQLVMGATDLFGAGTDTSASTVSWIILHLLRDPQLQERAFMAIKEVVGLERFPTSEDRKNLPLVEAIICESQRRNNLVPWVGRQVTQETKFRDWTLPKGTKVLTNLYALCMDPGVWPEPKKYDPKRFLTGEGKMNREALSQLEPFGFGKRRCLGESLARAEVFLMTATLIQRFRFVLPEGETMMPDPENHYRCLVCAPHPYHVVAESRY